MVGGDRINGIIGQRLTDGGEVKCPACVVIEPVPVAWRARMSAGRRAKCLTCQPSGEGS